jgi:disulfide bond formation protein DsbB
MVRHTQGFSPVMFRDEQIATIVGAGALALLLGALGFQYLAHLPPCEMCHWQRWPHIAAALIGFVGAYLWKGDKRMFTIPVILLIPLLGVWIAKQNDMVPYIAAVTLLLAGFAALKGDTRHIALVTIALLTVSGLVGAYQTALQQGLVPMPPCSVAHPYVMGSGAAEPQVSCNAVTWSLFGLSLAAYNAIFSFVIAATGAFLLSRKHAA